jgi:hypothetical protein
LQREDGVWVLEIILGMKHEMYEISKLRSVKFGENTKGYVKLMDIISE